MSWSNSNNEGKDFVPTSFKKQRGQVAKDIMSAGRGEGPATAAYQGPFVAGMSEGEQAALANVGGFRGSTTDQPSVDYLQSVVRGDQLDFYNDPAFQEMLDFAGRRYVSSFDDQEDATKALFARAGHQLPNSSPFARAQADITTAKSQGLADLGAQLIGQEFGAARDRQMAAAPQLSNIETARLDRAREILEAEGLPRLIRDMGIERGREEFSRRRDLLMQALGLELEMASPHLIGTGTSSSVGIL